MEKYRNKTDISILTKIFSIYVVLLPITQYYKSPLTMFNLATFMAIVFLFVFITKLNNNMQLDKRSFPIKIYISFITINVIFASIINNTSFSNLNILNYLRAMLLIITILIVGKNYFDRGYALKALETILLLSSAFMVIQLICIFILHHPISGNIGFLVTKSSYAIGKNRPSGFYMEPAAYAQSAMIYLAFSLFRNKEWSNAEKYKTIWIALGIIFSGSGQGYAFLALILFIWMLYNMFFRALTKQSFFKGILLIILLIIGIMIILKTQYGQYVLSRIINDENSDGLATLGGKALSGRTYTNKRFYELTNIQQLFGVGFGRSNVVIGDYYVNSLYYYLIECGYISIAVWLIMGLLTFRKGNLCVKVFLLIYTIMFYFSGCGRPMMVCFNFMFLLYDNYCSNNYSLGNDRKDKELNNEENCNGNSSPNS